MLEQAGLLYQLSDEDVAIGIQIPSTSEQLRLYKNTTDGNWYTINKNGTKTRFTPQRGAAVLVSNYDASGGTFPPSNSGSGDGGLVLKGDMYNVTVAGIINGNYVRIGHVIMALSDQPEQVTSAWGIYENAQNKVVSEIFTIGDQDTPIEEGSGVLKFRFPYAAEILEVRASLGVAQVGGDIFTVDIINSATGNSIFAANKEVTIDNGEKTSVTASTANVLDGAETVFPNDGEVSVDIEQVGADSIAAGLKLTIFYARKQ